MYHYTLISLIPIRRVGSLPEYKLSIIHHDKYVNYHNYGPSLRDHNLEWQYKQRTTLRYWEARQYALPRGTEQVDVHDQEIIESRHQVQINP